MKNITMPFSEASEFDRICAMEILPAIVRAYGSIASIHSERNDALLIAATERIPEVVEELCAEMARTYMWGQPTDKTGKALDSISQSWAKRDTYSEAIQTLSHTESQTATD